MGWLTAHHDRHMHKSSLKPRRRKRWQGAVVLAAAFILLSGCTGGRVAYISYVVPTGGNAAPGQRVILNKDCGTCHTIPGIRGAHGVVGPPLTSFAQRTFIAGVLPNTPANLVQWVHSPRSIQANTAMPDLGLSDQQARDVAAYLYTLR